MRGYRHASGCLVLAESVVRVSTDHGYISIQAYSTLSAEAGRRRLRGKRPPTGTGTDSAEHAQFNSAPAKSCIWGLRRGRCWQRPRESGHGAVNRENAEIESSHLTIEHPPPVGATIGPEPDRAMKRLLRSGAIAGR